MPYDAYHDASMDATPTDALVGQVLDGFRILEMVGRGGMGRVYRAEDEALGRIVALKVIDPAFAQNAAFLRRFRAEARALARIDSPHIVGIHALRQTASHSFIVMEYVGGGTLHDALDGRPMKPEQVVPIFEQVLRALEHAHGVGVIHRDIKPRNIMLTERGRVKVTDFGLAKLADTEATVTQGTMGTVAYMAPEQAEGHEADHRADLWATGMSLYESLAGRLPFDRGGTQIAILRTITEANLPPPTQWQPDLPAGLSDVVMRALERDPARRFQSAAEMREALEHVGTRGGSREPVPPPGPSPGPSPGPPKPQASGGAGSTGSVLRWVAVAAGLVLLLGGGWAAWRALGDRHAQISIETDPAGALVYLGDELLPQRTPLREHEVEEGALLVRVEKEGFVPFDTAVAVQPGQRLALRPPLRRARATGLASLTVLANPPDARILLDGVPVEANPYEDQLPPGSYDLRVERRGYEPWEKALVVEAGELYEEVATLAPAAEPERTAVDPPERRQETGREEPGREEPAGREEAPRFATLEVRSTPSGAAVYLDGRRVGLTPYADREASPRRVRVEVRQEGYESWAREVTLRAGGGETVRAELEPLAASCPTHTVNVVARADGQPLPNGRVFVDGTDRGAVPTQLQLGSGTYTIEVRKYGYQSASTTLELSPQAERCSAGVSLELQAQGGGY